MVHVGRGTVCGFVSEWGRVLGGSVRKMTGVGKVCRYVSLYTEDGPRVRERQRVGGQAGSTA